MTTKGGHKSSEVIEGLAVLSKNGLRYPIPPYGDSYFLSKVARRAGGALQLITHSLDVNE